MNKQRFPIDANRHYTYKDAESLLADTDILLDMLKHHQEVQLPRLEQLENYYLGNNVTVLEEVRRKEQHQADHRATHNFAKYVSDFIKGYMMGIPLKTTYAEDDKTDELLRDINVTNDADDHNSELILNQSIFGRAYELVYRSKDDEAVFVEMDVKGTFVVYDDTVARDPILAVRYSADRFEDNKVTVRVYTDNKIITYESDEGLNELTKVDDDTHYFEGVPIVEYENNKYRQGDFEDVLNLIDLYDAAQSDTANYMTDFNDAMLKITGNADLTTDDAMEMKEANILLLEPSIDEHGNESKVEADYIFKQYDVAGTEAYKARIFNNLLLMTSIPDLSDESFGGNQSGEAMKYKLFGLEQKRATKERSFIRSLRRRYELISNILTTASEGSFDVSKIDVTFTENLPKNIQAEMEWFISAGGELSQETMLSQLTFVDNAQEEMDRIKEESPQEGARSSMFEFPESDEEVIEETVVDE